jgi:hypothetical protein
MANITMLSTHLWTKLIDEIILTQCDLTTASKEDLDWLKSNLVTIITTLNDNDSEGIYTFLVLANRRSGCGQFAFTFNRKLAKIAMSRSYVDLLNLINKSQNEDVIPECVSNSLLTLEQKQIILNHLKKEMLILNMTMDILLTSENTTKIKDKILGGDQHVQCFGSICDHESNYAVSVDPMPSLVMVPSRDINDPFTTIYTFPLIQLINLIITDSINPYTNFKFNDETVKMIKNKYQIEIAMIKYFVQ